MDDRSIIRAKEAVFDAVRFLAPDEAQRLLQELADSMKKLADEYDSNLASVICR
jgi:hypothetical protein